MVVKKPEQVSSRYLGLWSMVGILYGVWYLFITARKHIQQHTCPADARRWPVSISTICKSFWGSSITDCSKLSKYVNWSTNANRRFKFLCLTNQVWCQECAMLLLFVYECLCAAFQTRSDSNINIPTLLQKINLNNCSANSNPRPRKAQIFAKQ